MPNKSASMIPLRLRIKRQLQKNWILYLMNLPVFLYFIVFHYYPMYGATLAFRDYRVKAGILGSPWIGFLNFERFFCSSYFETMLTNTLGISVYSLLVGFPISIIFALQLNYLQSNKLKKTIQMASYAPHFISTVVIACMLTLFTKHETGVFNSVFRAALGLKSVNWLAVPSWFKSIYVWSGIWQNMGWNAIIYLSALAGVDPQMHEAAIIDGATKLQRIRHIDIPSISSTIIMLLILRMGSMMSVGFEKVFLLQNDLNYKASVTISTYVYRIGLLDGDYSFSTAVGLFNNVINITLLVSVNKLSRRVLGESLF